MKISDCSLSRRLRRALENYFGDDVTVEDLLRVGRREFRYIGGIGPIGLRDVHAFLSDYDKLRTKVVTSEKVEAVARAIWEARRKWVKENYVDTPDLDEWGDGAVPLANGVISEAEAAIVALEIDG